MKKLVIFDFDGTLIDTITDVGICFNKTLEYYGFPTYPVDSYGEMVGGNLETIFSKLLPAKKINDSIIEKLKIKYRDVYANDKKPNTKPFTGILELLIELKKNNIKVGINTNKSQSLTEQLCNKFFSNINFDGIRGYLDIRPSKPDPYSVYELMDINGVSKSETVYVGDGDTDIKTAENGGIDCIFVLWGQGDEKLRFDKSVTFVAKEAGDIFTLIGGRKFEKN